MGNLKINENIFAITVSDLQSEANEKIGRDLTDDEILIAKKGLENALLIDIESIYKTIFNEMINNG